MRKKTTQKQEITKVQNPCFLAAADYPVLMYRQQSGRFRSFDDPSRIVHVGVPGMADSAMIAPMKITPDMVGQVIGVAVQVEFKTGGGTQSPKQKIWESGVNGAGGRYEIIRSADQFKALLDQICGKT